MNHGAINRWDSVLRLCFQLWPSDQTCLGTTDCLIWFNEIEFVNWLGMWPAGFVSALHSVLFLNWKQHWNIKRFHIKRDSWFFLKSGSTCRILHGNEGLELTEFRGAFALQLAAVPSAHCWLLDAEADRQLFFANLYILKILNVKEYFYVAMFSKREKKGKADHVTHSHYSMSLALVGIWMWCDDYLSPLCLLGL